MDIDVYDLGTHANRHKKRLEIKATKDGDEIRSIWSDRKIEYRQNGTLGWKSDREESGERKWTTLEWKQWQGEKGETQRLDRLWG